MSRPNIAQPAAALLGLFAALLITTACTGATPTPTSTPPPTTTSIPTQTPLPTVTPTPLVLLPRDEAPHAALVEWWYFSGLLTDDAGREYSYHFVTFQGPGPANAVPHLMHASLGDHSRGEHFAGETPTLAPVSADAVGVSVEAGGWEMRGDGAAYDLQFDLGGITLDFRAVSKRAPVLHDRNGLVSLGPAGDTYYYSRTRLASSGFVENQGERRPVSGVSWMDHQWGDVSGRDAGWDWLSLHLDDGADLMAAVVWAPDTRQPIATYGTYVGTDGKVVYLDGNDVSVKSIGSWTSPDTGITYPSGWVLEVPPLGLTLEATPVLKDAEFAVSRFVKAAYWEGAVTASGTQGGLPLSGAGFMELVGYDPRQLEVSEPPPTRE